MKFAKVGGAGGGFEEWSEGIGRCTVSRRARGGRLGRADVEARADAVGCPVLAAHVIGREAMMRLLRLVAESHGVLRGDLERRVGLLNAAGD